MCDNTWELGPPVSMSLELMSVDLCRADICSRLKFSPRVDSHSKYNHKGACHIEPRAQYFLTSPQLIPASPFYNVWIGDRMILLQFITRKCVTNCFFNLQKMAILGIVLPEPLCLYCLDIKTGAGLRMIVHRGVGFCCGLREWLIGDGWMHTEGE